MNKKIFIVLLVALLGSWMCAFAQEASAPQSETAVVAVAGEASVPAGEVDAADTDSSLVKAVKYIAAALAVGIACLGGAMAVGKIGAAAMGALSENAEVSGKALPFVGLAEGICLWGFIVAFLIIFM